MKNSWGVPIKEGFFKTNGGRLLWFLKVLKTGGYAESL